MSLADALKLVLLKERMAQEQTKGPSELERLAAEFKERLAKEQERTQEQPGEKQPEKEQEQDKKNDNEQKKGRQKVIVKDWEPDL